MNADAVQRCMDLIGAAQAMMGRGAQWKSDDTLRGLYEEIFDRLDVDGTAAFEAVKDAIIAAGRAPNTAELSVILARLTRTRNEADTYRRQQASPTEPGHALRLMREGFVTRWERDHPGEPMPPEMDRLMTHLSNSRAEQAKTWRANQTETGFAARPNIVLDAPERSGVAVQVDTRPASPSRFAQAAVSATQRRSGSDSPASPAWFAGLEGEEV